MERSEIHQIVSKLDTVIPKWDAKVSVSEYHCDCDEFIVVGTETGYLRLGVEFLKAGLVPYKNPDEPFEIDVDVNDVITTESDVRFCHFERRESLPDTAQEEERWQDKLFKWVVLGIVFLIPGLALFGLVTLIKLIIGST